MTNRSNYNFTGWQTKALGRQPTEAELATAHALGRPGKQSLALAMAMRECGVTAAQVLTAVATVYGGKGTPQNNHRKAWLVSGHLERQQPFNSGGQALYKVTLTDKGRAYVERRAAEVTEAKAEVKAKAKAPRKPKVKPQPEVTPEVTAVPEVPQGEQPTA